MKADIRQLEPGLLQLLGDIDYQSGPALRVSGGRLIKAAPGPDLRLDCSAVERSSSVGLSLLLCFMRDAHAVGKRLTVSGMPTEMRQIASVSGLDELLAGSD